MDPEDRVITGFHCIMVLFNNKRTVTVIYNIIQSYVQDNLKACLLLFRILGPIRLKVQYNKVTTASIGVIRLQVFKLSGLQLYQFALSRWVSEVCDLYNRPAHAN